MSKPRLEVTSDGRPILHGCLKVKEYDWPEAKVDLSEILLNRDGELCFNGEYHIPAVLDCEPMLMVYMYRGCRSEGR